MKKISRITVILVISTITEKRKVHNGSANFQSVICNKKSCREVRKGSNCSINWVNQNLFANDKTFFSCFIPPPKKNINDGKYDINNSILSSYLNDDSSSQNADTLNKITKNMDESCSHIYISTELCNWISWKILLQQGRILSNYDILVKFIN